MSIPARDPTLSTTPAETEWFVEVVRDAQAGSISAFNSLFQYYNARICIYLTRMVGNDEEGHDLAQETFIKVWRALPGMNDQSHFDTWLYRIATNTAIDHLRRRRSRWPLWRSSAELAPDYGSLAILSFGGSDIGWQNFIMCLTF